MTQEEIKDKAEQIAKYATIHVDANGAKNKITKLVSTACKDDSVAFGEWLGKECRRNNPEGWYFWKTGNFFKTSELYDIFHTENEGI
jgi:hypothetical protein